MELTQAIKLLSSDPINEAIAQLRIAAAQTEDIITKVLAAESSGEIDTEDANEQIQNTIALHAQAQIDALEANADVNIGMDEVADELERIEMTGSPIESFGEGAINLILEQCDSLEEGMEIVSDATGIDLDRLDDICADEVMPTPEEAMAILSQFHGLDERDLAHAMSLVPDMANMNANTATMARFSALQAQVDRQGEAIAASQWLGEQCTRFRALSDRADRAADKHQITPAERRELIPEISADRLPEQLAQFSYKIDLVAQMNKIESQLEFIERREPSTHPMFAGNANFSAVQVPSTGEDFLKTYRERNSY